MICRMTGRGRLIRSSKTGELAGAVTGKKVPSVKTTPAPLAVVRDRLFGWSLNLLARTLFHLLSANHIARNIHSLNIYLSLEYA